MAMSWSCGFNRCTVISRLLSSAAFTASSIARRTTGRVSACWPAGGGRAAGRGGQPNQFLNARFGGLLPENRRHKTQKRERNCHHRNRLVSSHCRSSVKRSKLVFVK